jgi:TRAP-type mannitol/chloroaromatic compound transport system permease small subunit
MIDAINERLGRLIAWLVLVAVLVSAGNAVVRKVFDTSSNAWLELQWYLFGAVFMLCAAWTLKNNEHIRIDILFGALSRRTQNRIDAFGHLVFLLPFCLLMVALCVPFFWSSFTSQEMSTNAGGLIVWPAKFMVLAGFVLLGAQAVSELIKRIAVLTGAMRDGAGASHAGHSGPPSQS